MYQREQEEYVTRKIEEIENSISFKKSALAWKTGNEVSGRKKSNKAKLKANSDKEFIKLWHAHFKELLGKPTSISTNDDINERSDQDITKLDIKTGLFTSYELTKAIQIFKAEKR